MVVVVVSRNKDRSDRPCRRFIMASVSRSDAVSTSKQTALVVFGLTESTANDFVSRTECTQITLRSALKAIEATGTKCHVAFTLVLSLR